MLLTRRKDWPPIDHAEIVRRSRLLVIDDSEFPYLPLFERDDYTIEQWTDVEDMGALEGGKYDLILLDLLGVGTAESADQGLGVLNHIRQVNPAQIVIAYSNAEWSVEYQPFFEHADAVLHKTKADYVTFKREVDRLLAERYSLGFYLGRVSNEIQDAPSRDYVMQRSRKALLSGDIEPLKRQLGKRLDEAVTVERILAIVQIGIGAAGLWKN